MNIDDASSIRDHIDKSMREEFYLAKEIPLPVEITSPIDTITSAKYSTRTKHWKDQLNAHRALQNNRENTQMICDVLTPATLKQATGEIKTSIVDHLAESLELGGREWVRQFTYGFPIVGNLPNAGYTAGAIR